APAAAWVVGDRAVEMAQRGTRAQVVAESHARPLAVLLEDGRDEVGVRGHHRRRAQAPDPTRTLSVPTGRVVVSSRISPLYVPHGCPSGTRIRATSGPSGPSPTIDTSSSLGASGSTERSACVIRWLPAAWGRRSTDTSVGCDDTTSIRTVR